MWILEHSLCSVSHFYISILSSSHCHHLKINIRSLKNYFECSPSTKQILPTKMSYSANLKNVMSMETGQRSTENQSLAEQELEASKPGPSPHDLAAQLKSSLLAEIGLTESDGPPLPSFRYRTAEPQTDRHIY